MTTGQRRARDEKMLSRILRGEHYEFVATEFGMSGRQVWRRLGKRIKAARQREQHAVAS